MKVFFIPIVFVILLSSCGAIKPIAPDLPQSHINTTPLPDSKIDIPVTIDLNHVMNDFSAKIPTEFSGEGSAGPGQYRWHIQRLPFHFSFSGNAINLIDSAHFNAGGYIKNPFNGQWGRICSCDADVTMGINASVDISNNYTLAGNARLTQFDLEGCDLKIANFNLTPILRPKIIDAVNNVLEGFNQHLSQYNFRPLLQSKWNALNQPVKIADIGYLVVNPSTIRLGRPSVSGSILNISAGITARPVFSLTNPGKTPSIPIPDISIGSGGSGFNLNMDAHLAYGPLNMILNNAIAGRKILNGTKGYVIIKEADIYGSGNDHLLIKIKFSGKEGVLPYHGLLYLTCKPVYDINTGIFYINDIDFDVSTIKKLKEGPAIWILDSALKDILKTQVHFNISDQINSLKDKLNQSLNQQVSPNVTLSGSVDSLSLQGILPVKDYILVRVSTSGSLAVKVN